MSYYQIVSNINDLLGNKGLLKLPNYIIEKFVETDHIKRVIDEIVDKYISGENILIEGPPGVGKTAILIIVLKKILDRGFKIAYLLDGATNISNKHISEGILIFCDDLTKYNAQTIRSIIVNRVTGIIATARSKELDYLEKKGIFVRKYFTSFKIQKMQQHVLQKILINYANAENITVDEEAINVIVKKADGLPIYCLLYTSPSPRDLSTSRMPSSA